MLFLCFLCANYHVVRCYVQVWANEANDKNRRIHLDLQMEHCQLDIIPSSKFKIKVKNLISVNGTPHTSLASLPLYSLVALPTVHFV